jgi:hypothetical protein
MYTKYVRLPRYRKVQPLMAFARLGVAVASVVVIAACSNSSSSSAAKKTAEATLDMSAVKTYQLAAPMHLETAISYPQSPPVGGDHNPAWQNCGYYPEPVQSELAVHSLEHGAVWITYRPGLSENDLGGLRALTQNQTHVLVTPYPGLSSAVVASAWGHQLALDDVSDPRLATFISTYQQGLQTLEPGAPCSGAFGEPQ